MPKFRYYFKYNLIPYYFFRNREIIRGIFIRLFFRIRVEALCFFIYCYIIFERVKKV